VAAYNCTPTYSHPIIAGRRHLLVNLDETNAAATDEWHIDLGEYLPHGLWKLIRVKMVKVAGTGVTYAPVWGEATNPTSGTIEYLGGLVAAGSQDSTNSGAGWVGQGPILYGRSVVNGASTDNHIKTRLLFCEGWDA
jgi:hypothetical protein